MTERILPELSALQVRVMAVLVEKEKTVPDTYPLTLNALTAGCNQKSSRDPVMQATDSEVQTAIDELRRRSLVIESSGGRVMRYAQNVGRVLGVPSQSVALLTVLALRGPQTAAELRLHSDRLHRFADISSVEAFLEELATRPEGALVRLMARQPGAREPRWELLLGEPVETSWGAASTEALPAGSVGGRAGGWSGGGASNELVTALEERLARLEGRVAELEGELTRLNAERPAA